MGIEGMIRGKLVKTTVSNPAIPCPRDTVNRQFRAAKPNALWVSDFTYVATWQGFVYVAFVIDVKLTRFGGAVQAFTRRLHDAQDTPALFA